MWYHAASEIQELPGETLGVAHLVPLAVPPEKLDEVTELLESGCVFSSCNLRQL